MTKRTSQQDRSDAAANSSAPTSQRTAYIMLSIIIIGLVALIGWFAYLLMSPDDSDQTPVVNVSDTTNSNKNTTTKNKNTNATTNSDTKNSNSGNSNATAEDNVEDETASESEDEGGLVEPDEEDEADDSDENDSDADDTEAAGEGHTLYFAASDSTCGEVVAVEREFELGEDPYGEIVLTMMRGPEDEETGADGIPSTVGLRQVEYTADGALVTVNEGYNELDECAQATVDAQFIETANAMFELPEGTSGTVVVGEVEADTESETTSESESTEETSTETE